MADVTGPISSLPGSLSTPPNEQTCDEHPERPAYRRVQGETDSFGCEMIDMCQECYEEHRRVMAEHATEARTGTCDWCRSQATDLRDHRDIDEGMSGPVYRVCGACIKRENEALREELDSYGDDYDYD